MSAAIWNRSFQRIGKPILAEACQMLVCEPYHLLRVVPRQDLPALDTLRTIEPLPPYARSSGKPQIVLHFQEAAREQGIKNISAFSRQSGLTWVTAAALWHDQVQVLDRDILARTVSTLGPPEQLRQIVCVTYESAEVKPKAGLVLSH